MTLFEKQIDTFQMWQGRGRPCRKAASATCKDFLQVQIEGERQISRRQKFYNLDAIIHRIQDEIIAKRKVATTKDCLVVRIEDARPAGRVAGRVLTQRHRAAEAQRPGRARAPRAPKGGL